MKLTTKIRGHFFRFQHIYKALILSLTFVLIIVMVWLAFFRAESLTKRTDNTSIKTKSKPALELAVSPLTGQTISSELKQRPVTAVVIENSPEARPQSGLIDAGIVFEAIEEGGITRFLALYQEAQPELLGPVRSLRAHHVAWARAFEAGVAHVGGSDEALSLARSIAGFRDMNQFAYGKYFFRSSDRRAPHNMYTKTTLLDSLNKEKGYTTSTFTSLKRKKENPSSTPTASVININFSSRLFNPEFRYDPVINGYYRYQAGVAHIDRESQKKIAPKSVVIMKMTYSNDAVGHSIYGTLGSGEALVFQDGNVTTGTWAKNSREEQIKITSPDGAVIALNPGQTWFIAVPNNKSVSYK
jgi:hypothetical protein